MDTPLDRCIQAAGSQSALARIVGTSQAAISWRVRNDKRSIPWEWAVAVERATGVPREELLPELFE